MAIAARRNRLGASTAIWIAAGVAIVVHGAVIGTTEVAGWRLGGSHPAFVASASPDADEPELKPTCVGDALLGAWARATMCYAPWRADQAACLDAVGDDLLIDRSTCQARNEPGTAVALISPRHIEQIKPIDPEPLLEAALQPLKPPPPVVVPPPQPATAPPPPPPPAPPRQAQVVETVKPAQEQAPDNARFLSEYDHNVKHETVARGAKTEPMVAKSQPAELQAVHDPKPASVQQELDRPPGTNPKAPDMPGTLSMRNPGALAPAEIAQETKTRGDDNGAQGPIADGSVMHHGDGAIEQQHRDRSEDPRGQGGAGGGTPDVPNLRPSQDVLERALGGGSVDHLDAVDDGDETSLSSKRWIYASFFNRLKRQVAQNWDPGSVWRREDPTGVRNGFKSRVTEVRVSLTPTGALRRIVVTQPSGVDDLDDEAVRAFRAAAPFPNPPEGLIASDQLITFAFSFYFEIGAPRASWKVMRSM